MKKRTDFILLVAFLLSLAVYLYAAFLYFAVYPSYHPRLMEVLNWLVMLFHLVPAFFLQLLLCRRLPRFLAVLPLLGLLGVLSYSVLGYLTAKGWSYLAYAYPLLLSIAPTVGCILAWVVYGWWWTYRKGDIRHV